MQAASDTPRPAEPADARRRIGDLRKQVTTLLAEQRRWRSIARRMSEKADALTAERDALAAELAAVREQVLGGHDSCVRAETENDALRQQLAAVRDSTQREHDLMRHQRHALLDEHLITQDEFTALVQEGSGSARRLEGYDALRQQLADAEARAKDWWRLLNNIFAAEDAASGPLMDAAWDQAYEALQRAAAARAEETAP